MAACAFALVTDGYECTVEGARYAKLLFTQRGLITIEVDNNLWIAPSQYAIWIPVGKKHLIRCVGSIEVYALFIDHTTASSLPDQCRMASVSALLRELIIATSELPYHNARQRADERMIAVMLDQIDSALVNGFQLPIPSDPRLRAISDSLIENPSDRATATNWAHRLGMSERSFFRFMRDKTGTSFGQWRKQFQILFALQRLKEGAAVQNIANELGYESSSAFITMFRKALGQSPARYLAKTSLSTPQLGKRP